MAGAEQADGIFASSLSQCPIIRPSRRCLPLKVTPSGDQPYQVSSSRLESKLIER